MTPTAGRRSPLSSPRRPGASRAACGSTRPAAWTTRRSTSWSRPSATATPGRRTSSPTTSRSRRTNGPCSARWPYPKAEHQACAARSAPECWYPCAPRRVGASRRRDVVAPEAAALVLFYGADDRAEQGRQLILLAAGEAGADQGLALVEGGEQPLDDVQALGLERHEHEPAVRVVAAAAGQAALLQGLQHAGQRALGHPGLGREVPGLLVTPDPQHEEHRERGPGQVLLREHLLLHVIADRVGRAVDVRHRRHRGEVELGVADACPNVALLLDQVLGTTEGEAARHGSMVRPERRAPGLSSWPGAGCRGTPSPRRARSKGPPRWPSAGRRSPPRCRTGPPRCSSSAGPIRRPRPPPRRPAGPAGS